MPPCATKLPRHVRAFLVRFGSALRKSHAVRPPLPLPIKPEILLSQSDLYRRHFRHSVVCHLDTITPYLRKRLIAARAPFLTQAGEFYLPGLLRTIPSPATKPRPLDTELTAMGKTAFLHFLLQGEPPRPSRTCALAPALSRGEPSGPTRNFSPPRAAAAKDRRPHQPHRLLHRRRPCRILLKKGWRLFGRTVKKTLSLPRDAVPEDAFEAAFPPSPLALFSWHRRRLFCDRPQTSRESPPLAVEEGDPAVIIQVLAFDPAPFAQD